MVLGTERPNFKAMKAARGRAPAYAYLTGVNALFFVGADFSRQVFEQGYIRTFKPMPGDYIPSTEWHINNAPQIIPDASYVLAHVATGVEALFYIMAAFRGIEAVSTYAWDNILHKKKS